MRKVLGIGIVFSVIMFWIVSVGLVQQPKTDEGEKKERGFSIYFDSSAPPYYESRFSRFNFFFGQELVRLRKISKTGFRKKYNILVKFVEEVYLDFPKEYPTILILVNFDQKLTLLRVKLEELTPEEMIKEAAILAATRVFITIKSSE